MGFIPEEIIRQVLDRADIVEVVSSYLALKQAGRNFKGLSPFKHEKTPSFIVSPDKQIFHCFSSGEGGNVISFVMKMERVGFPEAVRLLADRYGIVIPDERGPQGPSRDVTEQLRKVNALAADFFHRILLTDKTRTVEDARTYLKDRGIVLETVKLFQIGFAPDRWDGLITHLKQKKVPVSLMESAGLVIPRKQGDGFYDRFRNRIMFPIFDERARCVAFGARTMEKGNPAKYINSPETRAYTKGRHLYGFQLAKEEIARADQVIVVEGYLDLIMPYVFGVKNVVASLGTALTADQIRLMRRFTRNVVMLYDADPAGEAAMNRSLDILIDEGMNARVAVLPVQEDPDSFIRRYGPDKFRQRIQDAKTVVDFKIDFLTERYDIKTVEGRSRVAAELLPTVQRFRDPILSSEAMKTLARTLSIVQSALMTERALVAEINRLVQITEGRVVRQPRTQTEDPGAPLANISPAEETLLILMMVDGESRRMVSESGVVATCMGETARAIAHRIFENVNKGEEFSFSALIAGCDEQTGSLLSGLMAREESISGDRVKMCRDCIQTLTQGRLRRQRKMILTEMEQARDAGDQQRLDELTEQFSRLIKGV